MTAQPGERLLVKIPLPHPAFFHPKFIRRLGRTRAGFPARRTRGIRRLRGSCSPLPLIPQQQRPPRQRSRRVKLIRRNRNDVRAFWGKKPPSEGAGTPEAEPQPRQLAPFGKIFGKRSAPIPCPAPSRREPAVSCSTEHSLRGENFPRSPSDVSSSQTPSWSGFGARQLLNLWSLIGPHLPNSSSKLPIYRGRCDPKQSRSSAGPASAPCCKSRPRNRCHAAKPRLSPHFQQFSLKITPGEARFSFFFPPFPRWKPSPGWPGIAAHESTPNPDGAELPQSIQDTE